MGRSAGVEAILVGEALVTRDLGESRRAVPALPARPPLKRQSDREPVNRCSMRKLEIKFCGMTTLDDSMAAVEAGADLLGFNFYPHSPRDIEPAILQRNWRTS